MVPLHEQCWFMCYFFCSFFGNHEIYRKESLKMILRHNDINKLDEV